MLYNSNTKIEIFNIEFQIFPNPASDVLNIALSNISVKDIAVSIYSLDGKRMYHRTQSNSINSVIRIPLEDEFKPGVYLVTISSGKQISSRKLIVK